MVAEWAAESSSYSSREGKTVAESASSCNGKGKMIDPSKRCKKCKGKKVKKERKVLEVAIDKGARNNQKIKFNGESDQAPGIEPGDIIFVIKGKHW